MYFCRMIKNDTIIALATPSGVGAISLIRISGYNAITIVDSFFKSVKEGKQLIKQKIKFCFRLKRKPFFL